MNTFFDEYDFYWMNQAINEANNTGNFGEVPVGAVITDGKKILSAAGNTPISTIDPTAHAEINAIRQAAQATGNYRLPGTTLYVTLEPCLMCMGAIIHARIDRLVFGAFDPKSGAAVSKYKIGTDGMLNHQLLIKSGLLERECSSILTSFFRKKRRMS